MAPRLIFAYRRKTPRGDPLEAPTTILTLVHVVSHGRSVTRRRRAGGLTAGTSDVRGFIEALSEVQRIAPSKGIKHTDSVRTSGTLVLVRPRLDAS